MQLCAIDVWALSSSSLHTRLCSLTHSSPRRPVKERLVAYQGKLVTVQEQLGGAVPNGSGFVITTAAAPALDSTNLVVGHVVQGMDLVQQISQLPVVKSNTGSPFLKVCAACSPSAKHDLDAAENVSAACMHDGHRGL